MTKKHAHDTVVPFKDSDSAKKEQVAEMFNDIAYRYDFLNRFLSGGIDVYWRKKAIRELEEVQPQRILDVATGTADVALLTHKLLKPTKITGIDISEGMLEIGRKKVKEKGLQEIITLETGDSETINHPDASFDAITVAFGVRNFEHLEKGLSEMLRVLKPGGKLVVLEFSKPSGGFRPIYNLYIGTIAPQFGKIFSKSKEAYQYLNDSVRVFPEGPDFINILKDTGYCNTAMKRLSFGICTIYTGKKPG